MTSDRPVYRGDLNRVVDGVPNDYPDRCTDNAESGDEHGVQADVRGDADDTAQNSLRGRLIALTISPLRARKNSPTMSTVRVAHSISALSSRFVSAITER